MECKAIMNGMGATTGASRSVNLPTGCPHSESQSVCRLTLLACGRSVGSRPLYTAMFKTTGSGRNYTYGSRVPRRALSAYTIYLQDHYRRLRKHFNPRTNDQTVILKYCFKIWNEEPLHIRQRYIEWAKLDKLRAVRDRLEYLEAVVLYGEIPYAPSRKYKPRPPGYPRTTRNSFMYYVDEMRPTIREVNPNIRSSQLLKELGARWRQLSLDEKKPYMDRAQVDKRRFKNQKSAFKRNARNQKRMQRIEKTRTRLNRLFNNKVPDATPVSDQGGS